MFPLIANCLNTCNGGFDNLLAICVTFWIYFVCLRDRHFVSVCLRAPVNLLPWLVSFFWCVCFSHLPESCILPAPPVHFFFLLTGCMSDPWKPQAWNIIIWSFISQWKLIFISLMYLALHVNNNDYHKTLIVWRKVKHKSCLPILSLES